MSVLGTASLPFRFAYSAVFERHQQRFLLAQKIRALGSPGSPPAHDEEWVRSTSDESMKAFVESEDGKRVMPHDLCVFLNDMRQGEIAEACRDLLMQTVSGTWTALEILSRDLFVLLLNARPSLVERLAEDDIARRRFDMGKFARETLAQYGYDLSKSLGSVLASQQDLSDYQAIKSVYKALFPSDTKLQEALASDDLRLLSAQRNLIVHRRGIVDDEYRRISKSSQAAGDVLAVGPGEIEKSVQVVLATAEPLLAAAAAEAR